MPSEMFDKPVPAWKTICVISGKGRNFQTGIAATERVLLERCKMREGGDGPTRRPRTEYTQSRS
jgi:hypothetical protein